MLNLDDPEIALPEYKIKLKGQERTFDVLVLGYRFRALEGIEDPEKVQQAVKYAMGLDVDISPFEACMILDDFRKFSREEADEPLKKVFGRSLFSGTTTNSVPQKSGS